LEREKMDKEWSQHPASTTGTELRTSPPEREKEGLGTVEVGEERSGKVWDVASNLASAAFPRPS
jgi:hypothetical protein